MVWNPGFKVCHQELALSKESRLHFDAWTPVTQAMWTGLSRSSFHSAQGKDPVDFLEVRKLSMSSAYDTNPATIRLRAMVAVGFFGVRRCAESLKFSIDDVESQDKLDFHLLVKCQKNDQEGIGMRWVIAAVYSLGLTSPAVLLSKWIDCRDKLKKSYLKDEALFRIVAGSP